MALNPNVYLDPRKAADAASQVGAWSGSSTGSEACQIVRKKGATHRERRQRGARGWSKYKHRTTEELSGPSLRLFGCRRCQGVAACRADSFVVDGHPACVIDGSRFGGSGSGIEV